MYLSSFFVPITPKHCSINPSAVCTVGTTVPCRLYLRDNHFSSGTVVPRIEKHPISPHYCALYVFFAIRQLTSDEFGVDIGLRYQQRAGAADHDAPTLKTPGWVVARAQVIIVHSRKTKRVLKVFEESTRKVRYVYIDLQTVIFD